MRLCAVSALIVAGFDLSENRVRNLHPIIQAVQFTYQTVDDEDRSFGIEVCKSVLNVLPAADIGLSAVTCTDRVRCLSSYW